MEVYFPGVNIFEIPRVWISFSAFSRRNGIANSFPLNACTARKTEVITNAIHVSHTIPNIQRRRLAAMRRIRSTTLTTKPCFIYFTTNGVFTFIRSGTKKRNDARAAASFSWLDTTGEVGVSIRKKKENK